MDILLRAIRGKWVQADGFRRTRRPESAPVCEALGCKVRVLVIVIVGNTPIVYM